MPSGAYGGLGLITDDTQMTLFTAEGLLRAHHQLNDRGLADVPAVLHRAYLRCLYTQVQDADEVPWDAEVGENTSGWLVEQEFLHAPSDPTDQLGENPDRPARRECRRNSPGSKAGREPPTPTTASGGP
jgi:hypothetical protein